MAYGLKYYANFDSINSNGYSVEFLFKDYVGTSSAFVLSGSAVTLDWPGDDIRSVIRGGKATIGIINENGSFPLENLFANADDEIMCKIYFGSDVILTGFVVQEDTTDIMVDWSHELRVTVTDNLGLLKDIELNEAAKKRLTSVLTFTDLSGATGGVLAFTGSQDIRVGDFVSVDGGALYEVTAVSRALTLQYIRCRIPDFSPATIDVEVFRPYQLVGKVSLADIYSLCLLATNLELNTHVWTNIIADGSASQKVLEETFVNAEDYLNNSKWDNCYDIITKLNAAFNFQLFQAQNVWNLIRWDELRYNDNKITRRIYDSVFSYIIVDELQELPFIEIGDGNDIEAGATYGYIRPYAFSRKLFNYTQPENLLRNWNLQKLGRIRSEYADGSNTIREYDMPDWFAGFISPNSDYFIRITVDTASGTELSRIAVVTGSTGDQPRAVTSYPIEATAGDKMKWSFSYRTGVSQPGNVVNVFSVRLWDGTTQRYLNSDSEWVTVSGFTYNVLSGDNTNEWHTVTIESDVFPVSGLLYVYLGQATASSGDETWYKELSFEYITAVSESTKIKAHEHKNSQVLNTKNISEFEIYADDTRSNALRGTFFLSSETGVIRDRTALWSYTLIAPTNLRKLGEITTHEDLFCRRIARITSECTMLNIIHDLPISPLTVVKNQIFPDKIFVLGRIQVGLKRETANVTLMEMWDISTDTDDDNLVNTYVFRYLYDKI